MIFLANRTARFCTQYDRL